MIPTEQTAREVDEYIRLAGVQPPAGVLDVACGSGRHLVEFARRGYAVTGVDVSAEALAHAEAAAAGIGKIGLHRRDMRDLAGLGRFQLVVLLGNSLGYLPEPGLIELVRALAEATAQSGRLIIDCNISAESVLPSFLSGAGRERMTAGDISADVAAEYDVATSCYRSTYVFRQGARRVRVTAPHHVFTTGHIVHLVRQAGLADVRLSADPAGTPFTVGASRLVLTASRPALAGHPPVVPEEGSQ